MTAAATALERLLRRDRILIAIGLGGITALAWAYTLRAAAGGGHASGGATFTVLLLTWAVMMVAMMAPVVAPTVLTFAELSRRRRAERDPVYSAGWLSAGYLAVWAVYSLSGAILQWGVHRTGWAAALSTPAFAGGLFLLAGIYQLTPLKNACLSRCRSPLGALMTGWRPGAGGALRMGAEHGSHCVACCWALMALMLVAGMTSPLWMAAIAGLCLVERLLPGGPLTGRLAGAGLVVWGVWKLTGSALGAW